MSVTGIEQATPSGPGWPGPLVDETGATFLVPDPRKELQGVALHQEIGRPRNGPSFTFDEGRRAWKLRFPRRGVARMEYQIELFHGDDQSETICDPGNPKRAPGAFGDKSVVEFPGYAPPSWSAGRDQGSTEHLHLRSRPLRARLPVELWSPPGTAPTQPLPLLVAHDGPEYARFSQLKVYLSQMVTEGAIPPCRAALVAPVERDLAYSASAAYGRSFAHEILPALMDRAPTPHGRTMRLGMGASLGALAMLHIHRRNPATFGGLFLQSGSYFRMRFDKQESWFPKFRRISRFVGEVLTAEEWAHPIAVSITCGNVEENLANNRAVRDALAMQGYEVGHVENPDAHNWIAWRDTFDPCLTSLILRLWS